MCYFFFLSLSLLLYHYCLYGYISVFWWSHLNFDCFSFCIRSSVLFFSSNVHILNHFAVWSLLLNFVVVLYIDVCFFFLSFAAIWLLRICYQKVFLCNVYFFFFFFVSAQNSHMMSQLLKHIQLEFRFLFGEIGSLLLLLF